MAHKYQELSMISLLYYQETLTVTWGDANAETRTVIWRNSISSVPHLRVREGGGYREHRNDCVMLDFRQFSLSERKQHSTRALYELRRSRPNSIYRPVHPFLDKRKAITSQLPLEEYSLSLFR